MAGVASRTRAYEDGVEKEAYERSLRSQWGGNMPTGIEQLDKAGRQIWFLRSMPRINMANHEAWLRAELRSFGSAEALIEALGDDINEELIVQITAMEAGKW